jgi:hypothetical protein
MELRLENMTQDELVMIVMRSGVIPDEKTLAGIRIERLECKAVRIKESIELAGKAIKSGGLNKSGIAAAEVVRQIGQDEYVQAWNEISELTKKYFGEGK